MEALIVWEDGQTEVADDNGAERTMTVRDHVFNKICVLGGGWPIWVQESAKAIAPLDLPVNQTRLEAQPPMPVPEGPPPMQTSRGSGRPQGISQRFSALSESQLRNAERVRGWAGMLNEQTPFRVQNPSAPLESAESATASAERYARRVRQREMEFSGLTLQVQGMVVYSRYICDDDERPAGSAPEGPPFYRNVPAGCTCSSCRAIRSMDSFRTTDGRRQFSIGNNVTYAFTDVEPPVF